MHSVRKTALLKQVDGWESALPIRGVARFDEAQGRLGIALVNLEKRQGGEYFLVFGSAILKIDNLSGQEFFGVQTGEKYDTALVIFYDGKTIAPVISGSFSLQEINIGEALENAKRHFKICDKAEAQADVFQNEIYDDYAIADANYYEQDTISQGESYLNERTINNEELNYSQNATAKEEKEEFLFSNEPISASNSQFEQSQDQTNFYLKIKDELDALFKEYPKEERLCNMVEDSKWVKIGDGAKHYTVGVIYKNGQPEYVCYGLPGIFAQKQSAHGFSFFIPTSPFDLKGEGYWVSFQNAKNGKCVN